MLRPRKTAAFMLSLLLCASAYMPVASNAVIHENWGESETSEVTEKEDTSEAPSYEVSGDFSYLVMDDGNISIKDYSGSDTDVVIPDTIDGKKVTDLGSTALGTDYEGSPIETVTIPASIDYISADNPFIYCPNLKEIIVDSGNKDYISVDGVLYNKDKTKLLCYPPKKEGTSYTIDSNTTYIGASAIFMTQLQEIKFPAELDAIEHHGVASNYQLKAADLSGTAVTAIGNYAFAECTRLSDVKLPDTLDTIGGGAFSDCTALEDIELPMGLLSVGQSAFINTGLKRIIIPSSVQDIGYSAFGYNISKQGGEEYAVNGFTIIGEQGSAAATYSTDSDSDYDYHNEFIFMTPETYEESKEMEGVEKKFEGDIEYAVIDGHAVILGCSSADADLVIPDKLDGCDVTSIYTTAFSNCLSSSIKLPETITEVRKGGFYGCQNLKNLTLPKSVKEVGEAAFGNCPVLETVDLGGAETLGESLFEDCPAITSITISGNCKSIGGDEPFIEYTSLKEINVSEGDSGIFSSVDGVLYDKDMTMLLAYPASREGTYFKIPDTIKVIADSAFAYSNNLEEIDLSNVEEIASYGFERCQALKKVHMSKELKILGPDSFYGCTELKSLRFYDKVEQISDYSVGYYYDEEVNLLEGESESQEPTDKLVEGFKIYADKGTKPYQYAKDNGIEVVSGTVEIGEHNVSKVFIIVVAALIAALILGIICAAVIRKGKKKKEEKKQEQIKANVAEKLKARNEASEAEEKAEEEEKAAEEEETTDETE